jgi:hypothetical protein
VNRTELIELRSGPAAWLYVIHFFTSMLAAIAVLTTASNWGIKLLCVAVLICVHLAARRWMQGESHTGEVRLFTDGTASLLSRTQEFPGTQAEGGWVSRWLCVIPIIDLHSGRRLHCVICASENKADDYRRLLAWLRLSALHSDRQLF